MTGDEWLVYSLRRETTLSSSSFLLRFHFFIEFLDSLIVVVHHIVAILSAFLAVSLFLNLSLVLAKR